MIKSSFKMLKKTLVRATALNADICSTVNCIASDVEKCIIGVDSYDFHV